MLYKNKNIRALYKVQFVLMICGIFMAIAGAVVLIKIENKKELAYCGYQLVIGGILAVVGIVLFIVNAITIYISRQFDSVSEITAAQVDEEACKEGAVWLPITQICIMDGLVAGFPADIGNLNFSQSVFKYDEIKKIYGRMVKSNNTFGSLVLGKFRIIAVTCDDQNHVLSEVVASAYVKAKVLDELSTLYDECKKKNLSLICVPATLEYDE